jgi:hypothetical protein
MPQVIKNCKSQPLFIPAMPLLPRFISCGHILLDPNTAFAILQPKRGIRAGDHYGQESNQENRQEISR